jgi:hypothetical protein
VAPHGSLLPIFPVDAIHASADAIVNAWMDRFRRRAIVLLLQKLKRSQVAVPDPRKNHGGGLDFDDGDTLDPKGQSAVIPIPGVIRGIQVVCRLHQSSIQWDIELSQNKPREKESQEWTSLHTDSHDVGRRMKAEGMMDGWKHRKCAE